MTQAVRLIESSPRRIGGRYDVVGVLGRGGMAIAYRVSDAVTGREVALKQLVLPENEKQQRTAAALFEREFHTLAELSHPRIIEVYDYGVDEAGAFYTMELLDGGDLRQRTPLPWREACAIAYDVCSSLALIHSRRLVHRDVTPRNIRCTEDGQAKLIDFGAMVPMGPGGSVVGTPSFVAPEVVLGSGIDARADLFSLGATLYYALTGRAAYPATNFTQLPDVWKSKPPPPSQFIEGIPGALDALVGSLLALEPATRPHSAFEVMHRLSAIAGLERAEPAGVSRAYLTTPAMVGRDEAVGELHAQMVRAFKGRGRSILIVGAPGSGRSRMLDACALTAKVLGATVLRAGGRIGGGAPFGMARALVTQLAQALPEAAHSADSGGRVYDTGGAPSADQESLVRLVLDVSTENPLLLAVDDAEQIDEPSAAFLAELASEASRNRLLIAVAAEPELPGEGALALLATEAATLALEPLAAAETEELLGSVFGDVPNLGLVSQEIHAVSRGNPRVCMDLAQHLVDRGKVQYEAGTWTLPSALDSSDLPRSAEEAISERVASLSPLARRIAEAQALAARAAFSREDYTLLSQAEPSEQVDRALNELLAHQVLVSDGRLLSLAHVGWASVLLKPLSDEERKQRHGALVQVYDGKPDLDVVEHLFAAGETEPALNRLHSLLKVAGDASGVRKMSARDTREVAVILERAFAEAKALGRPPRELHDLRYWLSSIAVSADHEYYWLAAPEWLAQLERDSGLVRYRELSAIADENDRRSQAIGHAYQQYAATPEAERVYRPDEAIKLLVGYVVISIAIGSRTRDVLLLKSLPAIIEPFVPLSPVVEAMWQNAIATRESVCDGQLERYITRSLALYERLEKMTPEQLPHVDRIRHAIEFGVGVSSANMGLASATRWAGLLEQDTMQRISALYLRKAIRLQAGDWQGAEEFRKKAELLALQSRTGQMFDSTITLELAVHALARDLTGLKQVIDRIEVRAKRLPGWVCYRHLGEGEFQHACGNPELALAAFERAVSLTAPDPDDPSRVLAAYPAAAAGVVASLVELGQFEKAKAEGLRALDACKANGIGAQAHPLTRALSIAEAKLGDYAGASARLDAVIRAQTELGVTGLLLGATYEARARVAIWAGDEPAVERFGRLTAQEYRHGLGSPLGARYERLMDEARRKVALTLPKLWHFESTRAASRETADAVATQLLQGAESVEERGARVLSVLCTGRVSADGYLYLCSERGPTLVASQGAAEPGGLLGYVSDHLRRELQAGDGETAIVSEEDLAAEPAPVFTDEHGRTLRPIFLTAMIDDVPRYAAVAVVVEGPSESKPMDAALTAALAAHIIEAGDTPGIAASA